MRVRINFAAPEVNIFCCGEDKEGMMDGG